MGINENAWVTSFMRPWIYCREPGGLIGVEIGEIFGVDYSNVSQVRKEIRPDAGPRRERTKEYGNDKLENDNMKDLTPIALTKAAEIFW
jgi:hypothetical protein